ncbi:MAG TPA: transcription termination/antitermination NusG family protein, partial [Dermatophilaceae bacterium]|nr:transcription termination/antitermination NusG family protein [Dermatophilaceae bacterium]
MVEQADVAVEIDDAGVGVADTDADVAVVGEVAAADDPVAEDVAVDDAVEDEAAFRAKLRIQEGDWFVIHSYAGYENRVKANLQTRVTSLNMEPYIFDVQVPMETVTEIKNGQRK